MVRAAHSGDPFTRLPGPIDYNFTQLFSLNGTQVFLRMTQINARIRKRIPADLLRRMASQVSAEDRDEMAIPSYLHSNPMLRWMAWRRLEVIAALFRSAVQQRGAAFGRVVDFGCGSGVLFDELSRHANDVIGVDLVLEPARLLLDEWQLEKVRLMDPDAAQEEIAAGSVDAVVAAEVLEHIDPLDGTLDFFRSRLTRDGTLFVSVPTENALYRMGRRIAGFEDHYHESNAAAIHEQILRAGFRAVELRKIPAPGPLAIYWVAAYRLAG